MLNDRGVKLRSSDILKAQNLDKLPAEKQDEYSKAWEELEDELEEDFDAFLGICTGGAGARPLTAKFAERV